MSGGAPYRFVGMNIYQAASGGTPASCGGELYPDVSVPLSHSPDGITIRFWAFQRFFVSGGALDWTNFDQVLQIAASHHDKVIPVLANQYDYCDGVIKTSDWYQGGYAQTVIPGDLITYQDYVARFVSRYSTNPTIAMWQLVNEAEAVNPDGSCTESTAFSNLLGFATTMGAMVHGLDPNHLISLGALAGYSGSGAQWCGAANQDYGRLMASPGVDVCDFHDYGYPDLPMGLPVQPNLGTAISMCHADNKPIMVAETGILADSPDKLAGRAAAFRNKLSAQFQAGVVGELFWTWDVKPRYVIPDNDADYGICPGDPALDVLREFVRTV